MATRIDLDEPSLLICTVRQGIYIGLHGERVKKIYMRIGKGRPSVGILKLRFCQIYQIYLKMHVL